MQITFKLSDNNLIYTQSYSCIYLQRLGEILSKKIAGTMIQISRRPAIKETRCWEFCLLDHNYLITVKASGVYANKLAFYDRDPTSLASRPSL